MQGQQPVAVAARDFGGDRIEQLRRGAQALGEGGGEHDDRRGRRPARAAQRLRRRRRGTAGSSLGQPVSTTAKCPARAASARNGAVVAGPCVQYRSNMPRTRKWPRASPRFSTLKPWNSCTLAPATNGGTQLAALNTARGFSATASRRPTSAPALAAPPGAAPSSQRVHAMARGYAAPAPAVAGWAAHSARSRTTGNRPSTLPPAPPAPSGPDRGLRLSACIITFNEADRIADCLASLVVLRRGGRGRLRIHRRHRGDRRATGRARAAAAVRRLSAARSSSPSSRPATTGCSCLDADERVSDALARRHRGERARTASPARPDTASPGCSEYFGKFLRHGNAYPDRVLRLFDRRRGGWRGEREMHEAASVDGPVRCCKATSSTTLTARSSSSCSRPRPTRG